MAASNNILDDALNYYICKICMAIVSEPMMCGECETSYCTDCIVKWNERDRFR